MSRAQKSIAIIAIIGVTVLILALQEAFAQGKRQGWTDFRECLTEATRSDPTWRWPNQPYHMVEPARCHVDVSFP